MKIHDILDKLYAHIRTSDTISWPIILESNGTIKVTFFTYIILKESRTVYGIDRLISYANDKVEIENRKKFKKRDRFVISAPTIISREEHDKLASAYYTALEALANNYHSDKTEYIKEFKKAFCDVTPPEYYELYRRACPEFMKLLNL